MTRLSTKPMAYKVNHCLRKEAERYIVATRPLVPFPLDPVKHLLIPAIGKERLAFLLDMCTSYEDRKNRKQPWFAVNGHGFAACYPDITITFDRDSLRHVASTYPLPLDRQFLNVRSMVLDMIDSGWSIAIDVRLPTMFEGRLCDVGIHSSNLPPEIAEAVALFVVSRSIVTCNIYTAFQLVEMMYSDRKNIRVLANIFPSLRKTLSELVGYAIPEEKVNLMRCIKNSRLRNLIPGINAVLAVKHLIPKVETDDATQIPYPDIYYSMSPSARLLDLWLARQPG